jgi:thiamine biosynthesis lipoprotein ApbE
MEPAAPHSCGASRRELASGCRPGADGTPVATFFAALEEARAASGHALVVLDEQAQTIAFVREGVELNLGAIGKGYAVDTAHDLLVAAGTDHALVHSGFSSLRAWGRAPGPDGKAGWPVGVRHPLRRDTTLAQVVLRDRAMGVSGSAERHLEHDGRAVSHVLDPRCGVPARRHALAVAWAPDAALADALSTAFFVMSPAEVEAQCRRRPGVGALLVPALGDESGPLLFGDVPASLQLEPDFSGAAASRRPPLDGRSGRPEQRRRARGASRTPGRPVST